jgi:hypothetical protein
MRVHASLQVVFVSLLFIGIATASSYTTSYSCIVATDCTYSFSGGQSADGANLAASAEFVYNSNLNTLTVTITNLGNHGTATAYHASDLLGAVLFGNTALSALSASATNPVNTSVANAVINPQTGAPAQAFGSTVTGTPNSSGNPCQVSASGPNTDVSCGYVFEAGLNSALNGLDNGITSSGYYPVFASIAGGIQANFSPQGATGPNQAYIDGVLNGIPFAPSDVVTYDSGNTICANLGSTTCNYPVVNQYAVFTLSVNGTFNLSSIGNLGFQYGTDQMTNPFFSVAGPTPAPTTVPEPGFYGALAIGLGGLLCAVRRQRAKLQSSML